MSWGRSVTAPVASDTRPDLTVVYIAGSGRSGSTLLERVLGAIPGYVNTGELLDLPRRVGPQDEMCGCGEPFSRCPFWSAVGKRAFDGWTEPIWRQLHRQQHAIARQRYLPGLLTASASSRLGLRAQEYTAGYGRVAAAVTAEAAVPYLVDASKWPVIALALQRGGLDVRVIHLVRDVRGVAHSLSRDNIARPHVTHGEDVMYHQSPAIGAARWLAEQTEVDLIAARGVPVARLAYADLVTRPAESVTRVLAELALDVPPGGLAHIDGTSVELTASHGLSGNPSRFRVGRTELRPDDRWRTQMARRDRVVAGAVGLPQLVRLRSTRRAAAIAGGGAHDAPTGGHATEAVGAAEPVESAEPVEAPSTFTPAEWPKVSVVIPTRGRPELVRETVATIVGQSYPGEIECFVVHDQEPPEPSLNELGRPGRSVRAVSNDGTPRLAGARNFGLTLVSGGLVASCDDDDLWHPTKVEKQVRRFLTDPDVIVLGTGIRLLQPGGKVVDWPGRADFVSYQTLLRNRVKELHSSTLMMRLDAYAKAGRYDESLPNGYAEDWDFVLRAARVGKVGLVREPLADIRKDGQSYYRGRAENAVAGLVAFLDKHPDIMADRRGRARVLGQLAFAESSIGHHQRARRLVLRSLLAWPASPHPYVALLQVVGRLDQARVAQLARRVGREIA